MSALTNRYTKSARRSAAYHNHTPSHIATLLGAQTNDQERCALAEKIIIELINKTKEQKDLLENNEKLLKDQKDMLENNDELLKEQKDLLETKDNERKELISEHKELFDNNDKLLHVQEDLLREREQLLARL